MSHLDGAPHPHPRRRVAATRDVHTAEGWRDHLESAGIEGVVELDDERTALPGGNPLVGAGGSPSSVVYSVTVPEDQYQDAVRILEARRSDRGDSNPLSGATMLRGALVVIGFLFLFAVVLVLRGGIE
jgi:hypothetical protein